VHAGEAGYCSADAIDNNGNTLTDASGKSYTWPGANLSPRFHSDSQSFGGSISTEDAPPLCC